MDQRVTDRAGYRELLEALRMLSGGSFPEGDRRTGEGRPAGTRTFKGNHPIDPVSALDKAALVELVPASTAFVLAKLITAAIHDSEATETGEEHQLL